MIRHRRLRQLAEQAGIELSIRGDFIVFEVQPSELWEFAELVQEEVRPADVAPVLLQQVEGA
jgi:hypothetical protein